MERTRERADVATLPLRLADGLGVDSRGHFATEIATELMQQSEDDEGAEEGREVLICVRARPPKLKVPLTSPSL